MTQSKPKKAQKISKKNVPETGVKTVSEKKAAPKNVLKKSVATEKKSPKKTEKKTRPADTKTKAALSAPLLLPPPA